MVCLIYFLVDFLIFVIVDKSTFGRYFQTAAFLRFLGTKKIDDWAIFANLGFFAIFFGACFLLIYVLRGIIWVC